MTGETIFIIGAAAASAAVAAGVIAAISLRVAWKRLSAKLDSEYGPKKK